MRAFVFIFISLWWAPASWAAHAYAMFDEAKYPAGFSHFGYANPTAPKGGELRLVSSLRTSTFDKYNPFTIKGTAPAYLTAVMFDSLLTTSMDETATAYGLLAEDVSVSGDRLSVVFHLRKEARFHDGSPVTAADVKHTFDTLLGPHVSPTYKSMLEDVAGCDVLDAQQVRFRFKVPSRELPLTVGSLPIFSRAWGQTGGRAKPFDQVVMDVPISSGPYRIGPVNFGRDITYVRDPSYWARDLNVQRGLNNFDQITVKIYQDNTARLEALKAGEYDMATFYSAGDWARRVKGRKFDSGELVKSAMVHRRPTGFQSFVLNTRRPMLSDVRVREALGLAIDYDWMNRQMFYNSYPRIRDLFGNTDCEATGLPSAEEQALLAPWRTELPTAVWGTMYEPPRTAEPGHSLRANLRQAQALLAQAGWVYRDGALRNAKGEPFVLEYLESRDTGIRLVSPWMRNLEKLGVTLKFMAVDFALYQQRLDKFDFDVTTIAFAGTQYPGKQLADIFGSQAANTEGSGNYFGVRSAAVDALVNRIVGANSKADMLPACRALDRVIMHSHYLIPQWSLNAHWLAYNGWRLAFKSPLPPYADAQEWVMTTWWSKPARGQAD